MTHHADDHQLAAQLAAEAGRLLVGLRMRIDDGDDPRTVKDEGDARSNDLLLARLAEARPGDSVLSEEATDDLTRLDAERVWIVDPLDGTREFGEPPRVDWAVHVALWAAGELIAGAVALPAMDEVLATQPAPLLAAPIDGPPRVVVSRSRPPEVAQHVVRSLDGVLVEMGSAGAKVTSVIRGEADVYVHAGGQYEWDSAAPVAVARAAGCHCSRIDGSPLRYNNGDPYLPDLVVCRPELADAVLGALAAWSPTP